VATENAEKGAAYLEENAKREGVMVTESGLQYEIVEAGGGSASHD
jgi:FKBP-type peptidyl-prolyl cis-trans isomerase FkpA